MRFAILMCGLAGLSAGCMVKGFSTVPDGPTSPTQLRAAAATARAEADALEAIAAEEQGTIDRTIRTIQDAAAELVPGAGGDALWGLLGLGAGWMVPTPGQRRRERLAGSEGRLGQVVAEKAAQAAQQ